MNLNFNLQNLQQHCRICLQKGDINIWTYKETLKSKEDIEENSLCMEDSTETSFMQLMEIFYNTQDLLQLTEEFPLLCWQCLKDLKYSYDFYEKVKLANIQLKNIYQESLNLCIEEEHLIEIADEVDVPELNENKQIETLEEKIINNPHININDANQKVILNKSNPYKHVPLAANDAFVITQFVPETLYASDRNFLNSNKADDEESQTAAQQLLTLNLKAVEVKNFENLESTPQPDNTERAVYMCQYCPQAFTKSDYLKTHIQKSHVCKFCTQPFIVTEDLFKHIREIHTEHKCAICHKLLSSHTNLRHHIKKVHRVNLPAKVTLLDFIKSTNIEENAQESKVEFLQDDVEATDIDFSTEYVWNNDDCIEMFSDRSEIN